MRHDESLTPQFIRLAKAFNLDPPPLSPSASAKAVVEGLFNLAYKNAPAGDIGSIEDEVIAHLVGWEGDPAVLIALLIESGYVSRSDEYRLVLNEWHVKAPGQLVGGMRKAKRKFVSETDDPSAIGIQKKRKEKKRSLPKLAEASRVLASLSTDEAIKIGTFQDPAMKKSWVEWITYRWVEIGKPLQAASVRKQAEEFTTWGPARSIKAIDYTIRNGWQGLREPEIDKNAPTSPAEKIAAIPTRGEVANV